jgi:hypothetical protein
VKLGRLLGGDAIRAFAIAYIASSFVTAVSWPASVQEIPDLNVDPVCRGIVQQAANPTEKGDADLAFSQYVGSEQAMRQKLAGEWATFLPGEKPTASHRKRAEWRATPISSHVWKSHGTRGS